MLDLDRPAVGIGHRAVLDADDRVVEALGQLADASAVDHEPVLLDGEFADWRTEITASAIVLAVGFSGAIGIFFGFYPARKASRLLPIEALRYE